jgi:hypothetical protein
VSPIWIVTVGLGVSNMCIRLSGYSRTPTIQGLRKRHTTRAIPIATTERMSAVRRSARCPQKDFFGPGSSASADRLWISSATSGMGYSRRVPDLFSSRKLA